MRLPSLYPFVRALSSQGMSPRRSLLSVLLAWLVAGCAGSPGLPAQQGSGTGPPTGQGTPREAASAAPTTSAPAQPTARPTPTPAPTPAAQELAFIRDGNLWLARLDGTSLFQLTRGGQDREPAWSPDGKHLVFLRGGDAATELYSIRSDGRDIRRLTSDRLEQFSPRWRPGGDWIACGQSRDADADGLPDSDETLEVWLLSHEGGARRRLADGFDPAWSPDGRRIAYASLGTDRRGPATGTGESGIHVLELQSAADRLALTTITIQADLESRYSFPFRPAPRRLRSPSWAANGTHLAATVDGRAGLAVTSDEAGGALEIWQINYEGAVGRVTFAPQGGRLVLESRPASGFEHIVTVDTATGRKTKIGGEQIGVSVREPSWAPDGARLAAISYPGPPGMRAGPRELVVLAAEGTPLLRVASGHLSQPAWNPVR